MKATFEMMSLHCVPYILYWIQAEWKFYIRTYCQIIWVNFTNMAAIIFFPSGCPHLANHPPSPCPHLSTFSWPPPPNVWTSFMDGPKVKRPSWSRDLARSHDKLKPLCLYYRRPMATKLRRMWTYFEGLLLQVKLWSSGLARSRDKQKPLYLYYQIDHQTWKDCNLRWHPPTHKVTLYFDHVVLRDHVTN